MSIKVDNLSNLFWDNGGYRFPNTYPHLIDGEWLEKVTPVMTTPVTGWVVLTGDFNYCEYKGELFFLKKDALISESKNKWRYILIKDHICTLFKNKANVLAKGTLVNSSLDKLQDIDFQFTLPVFNNFNHRILLPLSKQIYNWKKHIIPNAPIKTFGARYAIDNHDYSVFLRQLENNKTVLNGAKFEKSKFFTLLGRAKLTKKEHNWKNELVAKIKELLSGLDNDDVILARFGSDFGGAQFLRNKYVLTHNSYSLGVHKEEFKQVFNLDLAGLEDIELISLTTGKADSNTYFKINLKEVPIIESRESITDTFIKKLSRRNRVSFLNPYSTRAIYRKGKLGTWFNSNNNREHLLPQKVFFKIKPSLLAKSKYDRNFPLSRKLESYRSVYLYYCWNIDYVYRFKDDADIGNYYYKENNFIDPTTYFDNDSSNLALSTKTWTSNDGFLVVKPQYEDYFPWKKIGEPFTVGWLIGQFSLFLGNNENHFESDKPFIVKSPFLSLKRIKGLTNQVSRLTQNADAYEPPLVSSDTNYTFTLDIFGKLSARARQATKEADFLIGEKLLFTTWGLGAYSLFQPVMSDGYSYTLSSLEDSHTLISKWLTGGSWYYGYSIYGEDDYITEWAKDWMKMGYSNFNALHFDKYYSSPSKYRELKGHIKRNTNAFFISEDIDFTKTPIKEVKKGDIFFSDLDWYFYDHSEGNDLTQINSNWYTSWKDSKADLQDEEIVVYHDIQEGGIAIGKANVWETDTTLPDGQFIAEGSAISSDSSSNNKVRSRVTKITKLTERSFSTFDEVIHTLRNTPSSFFKQACIDFTLDDLKGNPYLFDLKGTDFYCYLDPQGRVNLIFKNSDKDVQESRKQIYAISANEALAKLDKTQWVNQKVNLSIYGHKVELPIKAFAQTIVATIELDTAHLEGRKQEALDSHKVEVTHALGKTYLRFDTSKLNVQGTSQFNVFDIERLDINNSRASEDYLLRRREYEIGNEAMQIEHEKMRFENAVKQNELITDTVLGTIGGALLSVGSVALAGTTGGLSAGLALTGIGKGLSIMKSGFSSGYRWQRFNEATENMNKGIALAIQKQLVNSYTIDLTYQRQRQDYAFNLRRMFNQESIHQTSSRERNLALDDKEQDLIGLPRKEDKEIYLEIWTISDKQKEYATEYHKEYGVDCRVANTLIPFGNGVKTGVYKLESCELLNLNDRTDLVLIKALLERGIQIVEWIEHEKVRELIPEDPRIAKLQQQIEASERRRQELENEKALLDTRIQELTVEIQNSKDEEERLTGELDSKKQELEKAKEDLKVVSQQLEFEVDKYDRLSTGYRKLEEEKAVEERLKNLYLDEKNKLSSEKNAIQIELNQKKKELSNTKDTNVRLEGQISSLNEQLNSEKQKSATCDTEHGASKKELERVKKELSELQGEHEILKLAKTAEELKVAQCELEKIELKEKSDKVAEIEAELTKVKEEKDELTKQYDAKLIEVQEKDKTIEGLRQLENFEEGKGTDMARYLDGLTHNLQNVVGRRLFYSRAFNQITDTIAIVHPSSTGTVCISEVQLVYVVLKKEPTLNWGYLPVLLYTGEHDGLVKSEYYGFFALNKSSMTKTYWGYSYRQYLTKRLDTWEEIKTHILGYYGKEKAYSVCTRYSYNFTDRPLPEFVNKDFSRIYGITDYLKADPEWKVSHVIYWDSSEGKTIGDFTWKSHKDDGTPNKEIKTFRDYATALLGFDPWEEEIKWPKA